MRIGYTTLQRISWRVTLTEASRERLRKRYMLAMVILLREERLLITSIRMGTRRRGQP
jgi:hypothetical protein